MSTCFQFYNIINKLSNKTLIKAHAVNREACGSVENEIKLKIIILLIENTIYLTIIC